MTTPPPLPQAPDEAVAALTAPDGPYLIGVRHHAPSLAAAVPRLLDAARPDVLLVELPAETQDFLGWLADEETVAPVALAAVPEPEPGADAAADRRGPAFYPFADFSPELAALRWARDAGVPVLACDLPLADRAWREPRQHGPAASGPDLRHALRDRLTGREGDDLWDRLVEAPAPGATPEELRRAALLTGWALRRDAADGPGIDPLDLARESWMRGRLREASRDGRRAAAVIGSFHAAALTGAALSADSLTEDPPSTQPQAPGHPPAGGPGSTVSLIPYTYPLLDARSGYPAGIRDPEWQHRVLDAAGDPDALREAVLRAAVAVSADLRAQGHPSGPADAREVARVAGDLAALRGLRAPGRGELVEALQTVLAQGEPLGRGRAVARAMERVLVGERTGRPTPAAPRGGLGPAVEREAAELGLPGPAEPGKERDLRLDPLRTPRDRRREILFRRLTVCGVPYADEQGVTGAGGADALTTRWTVTWTPATAAVLTTASVRGVTPAQAAQGVLRARARAARDEGGPTPAQALAALVAAAECALPELAEEALEELSRALPAAGSPAELLTGLALVDRLAAGHVAGFTPDGDRPARLAAASEVLSAAAVRAVEGITGSEDPEDARALVELARRADALGSLRLTDALAALAADGTPLMAAAAAAVRVLLGHAPAPELGARVASWVDAASGSAARAALTARLTGLCTAAGALLETAPDALDPLLDRVTELTDRAFLDRLPALRGGFDTLSPAARERLLETVETRIGTAVGDLTVDPATQAVWTRADLAAAQAVAALDLGVPLTPVPQPIAAPHPTGPVPPAGGAGGSITPAERWRLALGRHADELPSRTAPLATALDELYGAGRGEGSRGGLRARGGGREAPYPGVREWAEELTALFGPGVREEVLAAAAAAGRTDAVEALDPDAARPSVELLRTVLQHAGGLPESRVAALRPLVRRLVDELTRALATRLRPALTGAATARPTRRPGGGLDLARTLRANLATARRGDDGRIVVVPEHPVFHGRARRSADWRLIIVTDVSGSMEASTIWAALTASVLAGVPALSTHFLAFSTEVIDLTEHVSDPLSLLLETRVGGGTHIAAGLRHARRLVTAPSRTLVVVISDFEEGYPVGGLLGEVRELVGAGCHVLGCASLDDAGRPRYSPGTAGQLVAAGMPVAALSPLELARWVGERIR
ncbi:vWA domain-containing protein [Streptomyces xanthii]|uniref:VWA domain-containing protein n=1 Tax=Streptomyces xanthii TaxID=2768069 RepID=A0A7H1BEX9_9ACTN|nr:DUF5682 family protein [Streptomyces xanthii]QNS07284.1 VWA domain-containing protein [Streptomyces xanthii]